jgi:hypothetical protein
MTDDQGRSKSSLIVSHRRKHPIAAPIPEQKVRLIESAVRPLEHNTEMYPAADPGPRSGNEESTFFPENPWEEPLPCVKSQGAEERILLDWNTNPKGLGIARPKIPGPSGAADDISGYSRVQGAISRQSGQPQ